MIIYLNHMDARDSRKTLERLYKTLSPSDPLFGEVEHYYLKLYGDRSRLVWAGDLVRTMDGCLGFVTYVELQITTGLPVPIASIRTVNTCGNVEDTYRDLVTLQRVNWSALNKTLRVDRTLLNQFNRWIFEDGWVESRVDENYVRDIMLWANECELYTEFEVARQYEHQYVQEFENMVDEITHSSL